MAKAVFPRSLRSSRVKVKSRIDRGKQLEYEVFHNYKRTRSLEKAPLGKGVPNSGKGWHEYPDGARVLKKGAIETQPHHKTNFYVDENGNKHTLSTPPTKVLTTSQSVRERELENSASEFWVGGENKIGKYTGWNYRVLEKKGEPGEIRLHFSRDKFILVRVFEKLHWVQFSIPYDKDTALLKYTRGQIFWAGDKKFRE